MIDNQLRQAEFARGAKEEAEAASGKDPLVASASASQATNPKPKPVSSDKPETASLIDTTRELALSNRVETLADKVDKLRTETYLLTADCVVDDLPVFAMVPQTKKDLVEAVVKKLKHGDTITVGHPHTVGACGLVFMRKIECDPVTSGVTVLYVPVGISNKAVCAAEGGLNAIGAEGKKMFLMNFAFFK